MGEKVNTGNSIEDKELIKNLNLSVGCFSWYTIGCKNLFD